MAAKISWDTKGPDERRGKTRLAIGRDVRYKLLGNKKRAMPIGEGKILNISSGGVLFTAQTALPVGQRVELVVSWPVLLNGRLPLNLVIRGGVVRSDETQTAIKIAQYQFKTRGSSACKL
jgi:hypothetical protein